MTATQTAEGGARAVRSFLAFDYGTKRVGVATGNYSVDEQREAGADWPIPDVTKGFPL